MTDKKYLFICGCDRSGTTALVKLLNSHPHLCIGMERYKGLLKNEKRLNTLGAPRFEKANFFDIKSEETNIKWDHFYKPLEEKYDSSVYVGDKVPRYFQFYPYLRKTFEEAKHIFIIRDPYEVASSWKARANDDSDVNWPSGNGVKRSIAVWNHSLKLLYKQIKEENLNVLVLSYNALFSGKRGELDKVISYLELDSSIELDSTFEKMTSSWASRTEKPLLLTDHERDFVEENANFKLSKHILSTNH